MKNMMIAALVFCAAPLGAETFQIDPKHSQVMFSVRHLMISRVKGRFTKFEGSFDYEQGKPKTWKVSAKIASASINTDVEARDDHLRSADFFDVQACPDMTFKSTKVTDVKGDRAKLHGELTMHCVTKPVVLDLEIGGVAVVNGVKKAGAAAVGRINRKDFGLTWNKAMEAGGVVVGEDVEIAIDVEAAAK